MGVLKWGIQNSSFSNVVAASSFRQKLEKEKEPGDLLHSSSNFYKQLLQATLAWKIHMCTVKYQVASLLVA